MGSDVTLLIIRVKFKREIQTSLELFTLSSYVVFTARFEREILI